MEKKKKSTLFTNTDILAMVVLAFADLSIR